MSKKISVSVPTSELFNELQKIPTIEPLLWKMDGAAPRKQIDIVVAPYMVKADILQQLKGVETELVQWQAIGTNGVSDHLPEGFTLANATSVHEASTAELAVGLAIASLRGVRQAVEAKLKGAWESSHRTSLADRKVLIVGYGGLGKAVDQRLQGFETDTVRVASKARAERNSFGKTVHVHDTSELPKLLSEAEVVIVTLPLTEQTAKLFDAEMFSNMQDGALFINVGRGQVVDTEALIAELKAKRLRAALDVIDPEPLPKNHEIWECEDVIITPHVGGNTSAMLPRVVSLIARQADHLSKGEPFENIIFS